MPNAILQTLVGGVIGFLSALAVAALSIFWAYCHDRYRRAVRTHYEYLSWLRGLVPECEFIISTLNQLRPEYDDMIKSENLRCPTKQLNADFLAAARLGIMKHPRGTQLFPMLTSAYRDVVHTNDMMTRFEIRYTETAGSAKQYPEMQGILLPTSQCIPSVHASVTALLAAAREQEQLELDHAPTLSRWITIFAIVAAGLTIFLIGLIIVLATYAWRLDGLGHSLIDSQLSSQPSSPTPEPSPTPAETPVPRAIPVATPTLTPLPTPQPTQVPHRRHPRRHR
jgi:hypothetical protein